MDRGGDSVLTREEFATELASRNAPGWLRLLAASAGDRDAVAAVVDVLGVASIDSTASMSTLSPSLLFEHVEALAAGSPEGLREAATEWRRTPPEIDDPCWSAVWRGALRHLPESQRLSPSELLNAAPPVRCEAAILAPQTDVTPVGWSEVGSGDQSVVDYPRLRVLALRPWRDESISSEQLSPTELVKLRALRGRFGLLDASAVAFLEEYVSMSDGCWDPLDIALIAEALCSVGSPAVDRLRAIVAESLRRESAKGSGRDLGDLASIAYVLVSAWRVP